MAFDFEKMGWGASPEGPEAGVSKPRHLASLQRALGRIAGGERVPQTALERTAATVAPKADELTSKGERQMKRIVKGILKDLLSHPPAVSIPEDRGREWEGHFLEARHRGADGNEDL